MKSPGRSRRLRRDESGVAMVEFALLLPFLAIIVFATVDLARAYSAVDHLKNASREGAYLAQTQPDHQWDDGTGTCTSPGDIWDRVLKEAGSSASDLSMTITVVTSSGTKTYKTTGTNLPGVVPTQLICDNNAVTGATITVQVSDNRFTLLTPIAKSVAGNITLSASTTVQELG